MEEPVWGSSATMLDMARLDSKASQPGVIGCRPRTRGAACSLGFSYQNPTVTELQLAKSQKAERLASQELGLSRCLSSGTLGLSGRVQLQLPTGDLWKSACISQVLTSL